MITVNMHEAKIRLSELVRQVEEDGEIITLCRKGKPVAEIRAPAKGKLGRLIPQPDLAPQFIRYDPLEPLSEDEWPAEYR